MLNSKTLYDFCFIKKVDFDKKKKRMNEQKKETQQLKKKTMKNENLPNVNVLLPDEMR